MAASAITTLLLAFSISLAVADFHARKKDRSGVRDSFIASTLSGDIIHQCRLANAIISLAPQGPPETRSKFLLEAERIAELSTMRHPEDPRAWATLWKCRMLQGKFYPAYAAISRAVMLDRSLAVHRRLHRKTAILVRDRPGFNESLRILERMDQ
mgnify:CR=1 FL=1